MKPLIYLASPYTTPSIAVRTQRVREASIASATFMQQGSLIYCPVVHGHHIWAAMAPWNEVPYSYWVAHGLCMLAKCDILYVLRLKGWETSRGVLEEIEAAKGFNMPVLHWQYEPLTLIEPPNDSE